MSREYTRNISIIGAAETPTDLLYADHFDGLLKWDIVAGIGDSIFEIDPTIALRGSQSLYMKTRTTDAAIGDAIGASINLFMIPSQKVQMFFHFRLPSVTTPDNLIFIIERHDGTSVHRAHIAFFPNDPIFKYLNSAGTLTPIPDSAIALTIDTWHRLTVHLDFLNDLYVTSHINDRLLDISSLSLHVPANAPQLLTQIQMKITTIGAAPTEAYCDNISIIEG